MLPVASTGPVRPAYRVLGGISARAMGGGGGWGGDGLAQWMCAAAPRRRVGPLLAATGPAARGERSPFPPPRLPPAQPRDLLVRRHRGRLPVIHLPRGRPHEHRG